MRKLFKLLILVLFFLGHISLYALDQNLLDLFNKYARNPNSVNAQEQAYLFSKNAELQNMAGRGEVSNETYQRNQSNFQKINDQISNRAAEKAGLELSKQASKTPGSFKAWTDTDNLVGKKDGNVTLEDIKRVRTEYNKAVSEYLQKSGVKAAGNVDWAKRNETDFMPKAEQTREFTEINKWINKKGGTAYESKDAAKVEEAIRRNRTGAISLKDAQKYNQEMTNQIDHKAKALEKTNSLIEKIKAKNPQPGSANYDRLQQLESSSQKIGHQVAKYITRKAEINNLMVDKFGTGEKTVLPKEVVEAAKTRNIQTAKSALTVGKNARIFADKADNNMKNTVSKVTTVGAVKDSVSTGIEKAKYAVYDKANQLIGSRNLRKIVTSPDRYIEKTTGVTRGAPGSVQRSVLPNINSALKYGAGALVGAKVFDIVMQTYKTGNYLEGVKNLGVFYVAAKGGELAARHMLGGILAANPVTATGIGVFSVSYGLTREVFSKVSVGGKSLDAHTQEWYDKELFMSGRYDTEAKANLLKMYIEAVKRGHKLPPGMTLSQGWDNILKKYDKNSGGIFSGVFEAPDFATLIEFYNRAEKAVSEALKDSDIQPEEKELAKKILSKIEYGRNLAGDSSSGDNGTSGSDNNVTRYNKAQDEAKEIDRMLAELNSRFLKCILKIKVVDEKTGATITQTARIHLYGQPDVEKGIAEGDFIVYKNLNSGEYKVDAEADDYYSKREQPIQINREKKRIFAGTIKLKELDAPIDYTAKKSEESKQIDESIRKTALNIKDSELEKAKDVLREIDSLAGDGVILSKQATLDMRTHRLAWPIARYSSIKVSAICSIFMASDSPSVLPMMRSGAMLSVADMLNRVCNNLKEARVEFKQLALMIAALQQPNEVSGTIDAAYALGMMLFYKEYIENQAFNVSNIRYYSSYKEYNDNAKVAGDGKKEALKRDADYWLRVISKGGYSSVSTELDKFWSEGIKLLELKDEKNFLKDNQFIIKDYRNKYILESIAPQLYEYSQNNKLEKEKIFTVTLKDFSNALNACRVVVSGTIECSPQIIPVVLSLTNGKKKWDKKGTGSFTFAVPAKDLEQDSFDILRNIKIPEDMLTYASGAGRSDFIGLDLNRERIFYSIKVSGPDIEVKIEPYLFYAVKKIPYLKKPDSYDVACPLPDKVETSEEVNIALSEAVKAVKSIDKIGYDKANYIFYCREGETKIYLSRFNDSYSNMKGALSHNCDYEIRVQGYDVAKTKEIRSRYKNQIDKLEEERKKVDRKVSETLDTLKKERDAYYNSYVNENKEVSRKLEDLKKRDIEERKIFHDIMSSSGEYLNKLFSTMKSNHSSRNENSNFQTVNPEFISSKWIEGAMEEFHAGSMEIKSLQSGMMSVEQSLDVLCSDTNKAFQELQKVRMKICGHNAFMLAGSKVAYGLWSTNLNIVNETLLTAKLIASLNLSKFISENQERIDWYFNMRNKDIKDIDSILNDAEKQAEKIPQDAEIAKVNSYMTSVPAKVDEYVMAIQKAVMLKDSKSVKMPEGILDNKGSDKNLVNECTAVMQKLMPDYIGVIGEMLPPSMSVETPYSRLQEIINNLPWSELTEEQRKRVTAIQEKMKPMQMMYARYPNITRVSSVAIVSTLNGLGETPGERIQILIDKSSQAAERIKSIESGKEISAGITLERAQSLIKDALAWYDLMPDIPTLDAVRQRCSLFEKIVKTGVFEKNRVSNSLPPAPKFISVLGRDVPYDGNCIVYKYSQLPEISSEMAKSYENTEWKGKFAKALYYRFPSDKEYKIEFSNWGGDVKFYSYYDTGKDYEWPIAKEYLPMQINIYVRYSSKKDGKNSRVKYEPGITIIILP